MFIWLLFINDIQTDQCFPETIQFPRILGGYNGITAYTDMDISQDEEQIAIVGYSQSSDITGKTGSQPILISMKINGEYNFVISYQTNNDVVFQAVKWSQDGNQIFAFTGDKIKKWSMYIIDKDGTLLNTFTTKPDTNFIIKKNGIVQHGDYIYLAMKTTKAVILGYNIRQIDTKSAKIFAQSNAAQSDYDSLYIYDSDILIVFGQITTQSKQYWLIKTVNINNPAVPEWMQATQLNLINQISYYKNEGQNSHYYQCGTFSTINLRLYFRYMNLQNDDKQINRNSIGYYQFTQAFIQCYGILGSSNMMFVHIQASSNPINFWLATITFVDELNIQSKLKNLRNFSQQLNQLVNGFHKMDEPSKSFYIANVKNLLRPDDNKFSFQYQAAAIMIEDINQSCLNQEEVLQSTTLVISTPIIDTTIQETMELLTPYQIYIDQEIEVISQVNVLLQNSMKQVWCQPLRQIQQLQPDIVQYTIYSGKFTLTFDSYKLSDANANICGGGTFVYKFLDKDQTSLSPIFTQVDETLNELTIEINDESVQNLIYLDEQITSKEEGTSIKETVTIEILNPCKNGEIDKNGVIQPQIYFIKDEAFIMSLEVYFTSNMQYYGKCSKAYSIYINDQENLSELTNHPVFTIINGNQLQIKNDDDSNHGVYLLIIKQYLISNTDIYQTQQVKINVSRCKNTQLTIPDYQNVDFYIDQDKLMIPLLQWTSSYPECPILEYVPNFKNSDSDILTIVPSSSYAITYQNNVKSLTVLTNDKNYVGTYNIIILGKIPTYNDYFGKAEFKIQIYPPCQILASTINDQSFVINSQQNYQFKHSEFTYQNCMPPVTINYAVVSNLPTFLKYEPNERQFIVLATNIDQVGKYLIKLKGQYYSSYDAIYWAQTQFTITINPENNSPPFFEKPLKNIEVIVDTSVKYSLGKIFDPDQDDFTIKVILGSAANFVSYKNDILTIIPKYIHIGTYSIKVVLKDNNINPKSQNYKFTIQVKDIPKGNDNNEHQNETDEIVPPVIIGYDLPINATQDQIIQFQNLDQLYGKFGAKIKSVSYTGIVVVQFSDKIIVPKIHYETIFSKSVIRISIISKDQKEYENLKFTWKCTSITNKKMTIQLYFETPRMISIQDIRDSIEIKFMKNGYFIQESTGRAIKYQTTISKQIPRQIDQQGNQNKLQIQIVDAEFFNNIGETVQYSLIVLVMSNLALNLIMGTSLQYLWGMINVLQIIIFFPLLSLEFPPNAKMFYSLIVEITNFDVLPVQIFQNQLFAFEDQEPFNEEFNELDIFYYFTYNFVNIQLKTI